MKYSPKPLFLERMQQLLTDKQDYDNYIKSLETEPRVSIRCNTLKISPKELKTRLEKRGWKIEQPFKQYPEIMIINGKAGSLRSQIDENINNQEQKTSSINVSNNFSLGWVSDFAKSPQKLERGHEVGGNNLIPLSPGELGRSLEHQLGYYYVQETSSMIPIIALNPKPRERILDLCASPGSKTTQAAMFMQNKGTIIANDKDMSRIQILASNLERCGVSNTIITKKDGIFLCQLLEKDNFKFDKILIDAPCSGEGTFRSSPKGMLMWNINTVKKLSKIQKNLIKSAYKLLKNDGVLVYSTCTHAPEENEEVIDFAIKELGLKIESINLPIKCRQGITKWKDENYDENVKLSCRIYPQDNDSEGFFIAKLVKK